MLSYLGYLNFPSATEWPSLSIYRSAPAVCNPAGTHESFYIYSLWWFPGLRLQTNDLHLSVCIILLFEQCVRVLFLFPNESVRHKYGLHFSKGGYCSYRSYYLPISSYDYQSVKIDCIWT